MKAIEGVMIAASGAFSYAGTTLVNKVAENASLGATFAAAVGVAGIVGALLCKGYQYAGNAYTAPAPTRRTYSNNP